MNRRLWAALAACGLSVGLLVAMVPRPDELFEAHMRDATPNQTVTLLEEAHRTHPDDMKLAARLAWAYERAGKPAEGLSAIAAVARTRPLTLSERLLVGRLGFAEGRPERAVAVLTGTRQPLDARDHALVVKLALAAGALPEAVAAQRALAAHGDAKALERLAALSLQANDPKSALEAAERLLAEQDSPAWRRKAADFARWAKLPVRAVPHLRALYKQTPNAEDGLALARLLASAKPAEALPFARTLVADYPRDAEAFDHLLGLLARARRMEEARTVLAAHATRWPDDARSHARRVDFALGHGDRPEAIAELTRWVGRHRGDRAARHQLAVVQVWDGRTEAGWNTYQTLLADANGPMDRLEATWRTEWAQVSGALEDFTPEGRANLRRLTNARPADTALWRRLAAAESEAGERAAAIEAQRHVVGLPAAKGDDALRLAEWLLWDNRTAEGLALLKTLDDRKPLPSQVLDDAAERAGKAWRFADAADFLGRLAQRRPHDAETLEALAHAREAADDLAGAQAAWTQRLRLPGATSALRMLAAGIALKREKLDEALALVSAPDAEVAELQLQAYLAARLSRPEAQRRALERLVAKAPSDWEARLQLADLADQRGDGATAARQEQAAIALRPHDPQVIARLAGRRLYGPTPEAATPYVALLEKLSQPGPEGLRMLADYYQSRDAARAASALDRLHALKRGDAETYFRRGELAAQARDGAVAELAFTQAASRGSRATEAPEREAGAYALERLGRDAEAAAAWTQLQAAFPARPSAHVALARRAMAKGDLGAAASLLAAAEGLAPDSVEVKLTRAEWLRAGGREAEAAEAFAALRRAEPGARYLAAAEAMSRHAIGQYGRARAVVREALASAPFDADLLDAHRQVRALGASRVEGRAFYEQSGNLNRTRLGLGSVQRLGDRLRLLADVSTLAWDGGALQARELKLGARWVAPGVELGGHLALQTGQNAPLGGLMASVTRGHFQLQAQLEEARWEDSNAAVAAFGRERKALAEVAWQPDPRLGVRAEAGVGQLTAVGLTPGLSASGLVEAVARPQAASPWLVAYQLNHRHWGPAGVPLGLPEAMTLQSLFLGYDTRLGPLRLELRPGVMHDLRAGAFAPLAGGTLAWELGADQELMLQGVWSGRSFVTGVEGAYQQLSLTGQWFF